MAQTAMTPIQHDTSLITQGIPSDTSSTPGYVTFMKQYQTQILIGAAAFIAIKLLIKWKSLQILVFIRDIRIDSFLF